MPTRGWHSTKLHLSLIAMALVCVGYGLTGFKSELYGEFTMALLGAAGIYATSETASRFAKPHPPKVDSPD